MMKRTTIIFFSLLLIFSFLPGCDAPRDHNGNIVDIPEDNPTQIDSFRVFSRHYPPPGPFEPDDYRCYMEALISDPDGIGHVHLEVKDSLRINVDFSVTNGRYAYSFSPEDFDHSISSFEGAPFRLYVFDDLGYVTKSEKLTIIRALAYTPEPLSPGRPDPVFTDTTSSTPLLVWRQNESIYPIHYSVSIFDGDTHENVYSYSNIPKVVTSSNDTIDSLRVSSPLPPSLYDQYFWILSIYDEFGNETFSGKRNFVAIP